MLIKHIKKIFLISASVLFVVVMSMSVADAALQAAGAADPANGFPIWYQDLTGLSLAPCLDQNTACVLPPEFDPIITSPPLPITAGPASGITSTNFPLESFYFLADSLMNVGPGPTKAKADLRIALEGSFAGTTAQNTQQITFARINLKKMSNLTPNSTYVVTHPYGSFQFSTDDAGVTILGVAGQAFRTQDGCAAAPCDFAAVLTVPLTNMGPFLTWDTGFPYTTPDGKKYIGNPLVAHTVTGSPTGNNIFKIDGPNIGGPGINTVSTSLFNLSGKLLGIDISPATLQFPLQKAVVVSATKVVTVTNVNAIGNITLGTVVSTGTNSADFTVSVDSCSLATLAPAAACSFSVSFSGNAPDGIKTASISIPVTSPATVPSGAVSVSGSIDSTPPVVLTTLPLNASSVSSNATILATFSENVTNVTNTTFTVAAGGASVPGSVTYDAGTRTATFNPTSLLAFSVTHTASITTGIADVAGNALATTQTWTFIATPPDLTPPSVISVFPTNLVSGVSVTQTVTAVFSEHLDPASVNALSFTLSSPNGPISGSVTYNAATLTATFTPNARLDYGTQHTAVLTTAIDDVAKNHLASAVSWTFVTDFLPTVPKLVAPATGLTGVSASVDFSWHKSTDQDSDPLTYNLYYCNNPFFIGNSFACNTPIVLTKSTGIAGTFYAGISGLGFFLAGIVIIGGTKRGRAMTAVLLIVVALATGVVLHSCGGGGGSNPPPPDLTIMTRNVTGLTSGVTYYWKVVADDGRSGRTESEIRSFTTL